ncbi:MAG: hypothetical protein KBC64_06125 [Simkaniaceae bacterium]|nr:hypothetical protein [Simkaniaceae bacterium]
MESLSFYKEHELTSRLTSREVDSLEGALSRVLPSSIDQLCSDLESEAPFQGEFWSRHEYKTWPLIAFAALKAERCTVDQFATISLLFAALKEFVYTETHYSMRSLTPLSWELVRFNKEGFKDKGWRPISPSFPEYAKYLKVFFRGWNQEGKLRLERALARISPSDRYLFEIEMPRTPVEYWGPMIKAIKLATQDLLYPFLEEGLNILGCAEKRKLVLPAFPVLRLFAELIDSTMPIFMIPRLGTMTESDIMRDRFRFSHVVALEMEEIPLPMEADGNPTGPFAFGLHDIYHTFTYANRSSKMIILATNRMIQVLRSGMKDHPILDRLIAQLIDAEFMNDYPIEGYLVGHLFNNRHLKDAWDARCGLYKRVILVDIAKHRLFWNYICHDNVGLSAEDMALVPPDPKPTFPPDDELVALGMGDELLPFFKMAQALNWASIQIRDGMNGLTGNNYDERDRYRLCMFLFTHLPLEKSKEEISFIKGVSFCHISYLDYWKRFLIQGKSAKTLTFILSDHFILGRNLLPLNALFDASWDYFEQLVNLLARSRGKAFHAGSFTLSELEMIVSSGHRGVLSALLEQTERGNLSKKELLALLPDSLK